MALGGEQVAQHLAGADRGQLVDVADQQQVRAGRDGLDQLVGQDQIQHGRLVDDHQVGVQRVVPVEGGSPPGRSCSSRCTVAAGCPVSSASRLAARPVGAASTILARLAAARVDDGLDGEALAAARAAGQHRDLPVNASRTACSCSGASSGPVRLRSQASALSQSTSAKAGSRSAGVSSSRSRLPASDDLGAVERHQVHRRIVACRSRRCGLGERLADHALLGGELVQAGAGQLGGHARGSPAASATRFGSGR